MEDAQALGATPSDGPAPSSPEATPMLPADGSVDTMNPAASDQPMFREPSIYTVGFDQGHHPPTRRLDLSDD